jgi:hypothetical protein
MGYPVPGGCKYGDLALHVGGVSNLSQMWSGVPQDSDPKMNALAKASRPIHSSERMLHKDYDRRVPVAKKEVPGHKPRGVWRDSDSDLRQTSCEVAASQRGQKPLTTGAEETTLLGTVIRRRLVKTNWEDLACAVVSCEMRKLATAL